NLKKLPKNLYLFVHLSNKKTNLQKLYAITIKHSQKSLIWLVMRILFGYLEQFRIFVCSEEIPSGFPRYGSGLHTSSTALRDCPRTWVSRKRETCVKPRAVRHNLTATYEKNITTIIFDNLHNILSIKF